MTRRKYPAGDDSELQLAALLWLLARQRLEEKPCAVLTRMTLEHFDLIAGNPDVGGVVRVACARLVQQWRRAARAGQLPANPQRRRTWH